jgi:hypothetical protein
MTEEFLREHAGGLMAKPSSHSTSDSLDHSLLPLQIAHQFAKCLLHSTLDGEYPRTIRFWLDDSSGKSRFKE